jgi:hypothetical protein
MAAGMQITEDSIIGQAELLARVASLTPLIEETAARSKTLGTLAPEVSSSVAPSQTVRPVERTRSRRLRHRFS